MEDLRLHSPWRCVLYRYADRITMTITAAEWKRGRPVEVWGSQADLAKEEG